MAAPSIQSTSVVVVLVLVVELSEIEEPGAETVCRGVELTLLAHDRQARDLDVRHPAGGEPPRGRSGGKPERAEVGPGEEVTGLVVTDEVRDRLIGEVVTDIRPRRRARGRVEHDLEHVARASSAY